MRWWKFYLAALGILALLFPIKVIYVAFYAVAFLYFAGRWALRYAFSHLVVMRRHGAVRLFPGETADVHITFQNPTVIPLSWLSGHDSLPVELARGQVQRWVLSLPPFARQTVTYQVSGWHRGVYPIGPLHVTAGEPLGLYQFSTVLDSRERVIVYPQIYPLAQLSLPSDLSVGQVRTASHIHPDPTRIAGVRSYQAGDTWRSIHWKASARLGELQVKQYDHTLMVDVEILLNLDEREYSVHSFLPDSELAIAVAASLGSYFTDRNISFGLVINGGAVEAAKSDPAADSSGPALPSDAKGNDGSCLRLPHRKGREHLMLVLEALAAARCQPALDFPTLVLEKTARCSWGATVLLITPLDSDELVANCLRLVRSGYKVIIIVVGEKLRHRELLFRPAGDSLQMYHIMPHNLQHQSLALG